jgi:hypothetical protein
MSPSASPAPSPRAAAIAIAIAIASACASRGAPLAPAPGAAAPAAEAPAAAATGCAREIAIRCATGVDGCLDGRTIEHVCVADGAMAGPSCAVELALVCPPGQRDGCLTEPPVSRHHLCVIE